jgi:AcrR family transcriptional regulator
MIAADRIGRFGMKGATIRGVAEEAGYSTKAVTHYFPDKSGLMFRVYLEAALRSQERFDKAIAHDPLDIQGALEALLPIDPDSLRDWRIFIGSWDLAFSEGEFRDRQLYWQNNAREVIAKVLAARRDGGHGDHADPNEAPRLLMIVTGIATQAIFGDEYWSPSAQKAALAKELAR